MGNTVPPVSQFMTPSSIKQVRIHDRFWSPKQRKVMETVIPYQWDALNDAVPGAEPSHTLQNFRLAAKEAEGEYYGMVFQDSDLGKWLEAVGFVLSVTPDPQLEQLADEVIDLLGRAQQPDGYLNTYYTVKEPEKRWTNLRDHHELYCAGHLMEAAVAYYDATGKTKFLHIMCRYADYIASVFGKGEGQKQGYDGHPEIELALVKLARATGNDAYMELSKFFVDERGNQPHFFDLEAAERIAAGDLSRDHPGRKRTPYDYFQAHVPVREQHTAEGHSVRAVYLYSAMAELAAQYEDEPLMNACRQLWKDTVRRKMYVTGGIGSSAFQERFTVPFDLPNDRAYTETCAAIGLMFWAQRMLLIEKDRQYADVMELALFNGVLSGISLDGTSYFYVNPLEVWPSAADVRDDMKSVKVSRQPWFGCACCPPNIARLMASLGQYIYSEHKQEQELYVHLYMGSELHTVVDGKPIRLTQQTNYPWDGRIQLDVKPEAPVECTIALRIPGWCRHAELCLNGTPIELSTVEKGYVKLHRTWQSGDLIELLLSMPVERIYPNPQIRANAGKVALQRGPVVYCLEEEDNGANLQDIAMAADAPLDAHFDGQLLGGVTVLKGTGTRSVSPDDHEPLYAAQSFRREAVPLTAVPYFAWSNRSRGEMTVWIRES